MEVVAARRQAEVDGPCLRAMQTFPLPDNLIKRNQLWSEVSGFLSLTFSTQEENRWQNITSLSRTL